jgi:hypothetical protein
LTVERPCIRSRTELHEREGELGGIEDEVTDSVRRLADEVRTSVNDAMKSLRADLAAAARDARGDARASGRTTRSDPSAPRTQSRSNLQDAEVLLSDFRHQLRSELREWISHADLATETITVLRVELEGVRKAVTDSLRRAGS